MGQTTNEAAAEAAGAAEDSDDPSSQNPKRGFFARIVDALSPQEQATDHYLERPGASRADAATLPGLVNLRRMRVEDVAVPKAEIVAAPITSTQDELLSIFRGSGLTRVPVFDGTLDTPIGVANLKDFALKYGFNGEAGSFDLRAMLRPVIFVPPSMPLGVLLQKMQAERIHMALVIDEYGGTDGLLTIEDLIEQVVGEIEDEHDVDEVSSFVEEQPGCWLALARTPLDEFEAAIDRSLTSHAEIDEEEVETLGGLVFMLAGHVPTRGEVVQHPDGPDFEVIDADPRRIKRLRVRLSPAREG